jgi:hypothetical protein
MCRLAKIMHMPQLHHTYVVHPQMELHVECCRQEIKLDSKAAKQEAKSTAPGAEYLMLRQRVAQAMDTTGKPADTTDTVMLILECRRTVVCIDQPLAYGPDSRQILIWTSSRQGPGTSIEHAPWEVLAQPMVAVSKPPLSMGS